MFNYYTIFHELNQMQMSLVYFVGIKKNKLLVMIIIIEMIVKGSVAVNAFFCCFFFAGIRVWDVVSELVCLCTVPSPSNPFALDMRYIKSLPIPERFLVTGALLNFLELYVVYGNRDELHYDKGRILWKAAVLVNH